MDIFVLDVIGFLFKSFSEIEEEIIIVMKIIIDIILGKVFIFNVLFVFNILWEKIVELFN